MEIYKDLNSKATKEFEQLLISKFSKIKKVEEGKIYDAKVIKISNKFLTLNIDGLKQDPVLDTSQLKDLDLKDKIKEGSVIPVLLEKLEDKNLDCVVSATKAAKLAGWNEIVKKHAKNETIIVKLVSRVKGGLIASHVDSGMLCFMPGSQVASTPIKDVTELFNEPMKVKIIKLDAVRGNVCISRRQVIDSNEQADRAKAIESYSVGQTVTGTCKSFTSFGAFFSLNETTNDIPVDTMVHLQECSYSRINSPDEILELNKNYKLKIIGIDKTKNQISSSIKALAPDPFDNMGEFEVGKDYLAVIKKILDYGIFVEIKSGLSALCHSSELSWLKKNLHPKTFGKVNDKIMVRICEIDQEKRRISVSHRLTTPSPWVTLQNEVKVGSIIENSEIVGTNDYAIFVRIGKHPIEAMLHMNDLSFLGNPEQELSKFKKKQVLEKLKILEIDVENSKVRVSLREAISEDPYKFYENLSEGTILTCRVVETSNKGITVKPENCKIESFIRKSHLASSPSDQRAGRWTLGDKVDVLLEKKENRKVTLSIRALEEKLNAEALKKYGMESGSGKSLPFAKLSDELKKNKDKSEK